MEMKKKGKVNKERVMMLMKECTMNRRQWIVNDEPAVSEVQEHFPALMDHTMVIKALLYKVHNPYTVLNT